MYWHWQSVGRKPVGNGAVFAVTIATLVPGWPLVRPVGVLVPLTWDAISGLSAAAKLPSSIKVERARLLPDALPKLINADCMPLVPGVNGSVPANVAKTRLLPAAVSIALTPDSAYGAPLLGYMMPPKNPDSTCVVRLAPIADC